MHIGRMLTVGETAILRSVFGERITYAEVRIFPRRVMWPFPNDRAMAPWGSIYLPGDEHEYDFAAPSVSLAKRAVFVHEATHLYQWYGLGQTVWLRGPFDRNYQHELQEGKRFQDYGLEQMGMIAQHYFVLRSGGRLGGRYRRYRLADYAPLLPVR